MTFGGVIGPRSDGLAVLVVVQVGLMATLGSVGHGLPLRRGAGLGLVLGARGGACEVTEGETLGQFLGGFALLASTDRGKEGDGVGALEVTGEVGPLAVGQVDGEGRTGLSVDGADAELVAVLLASGEPLTAEGFK